MEFCKSDEVGDRAPQRPSWLLDERASAGRENLDAIHVSRYDAKEDAKALDEVRLLQGLGLDASSTVLDLGAQPDEAEERIESWCATGGTGIETDWIRAELEEHVRDEHSTFTWLLEPMIERSGFRIDEADYSLDGIFASYVVRRR